MTPARLGTCLALLALTAGALVAPAAYGQRQMPADPTEARSTAPGYGEFVAASADYEVVPRVEWRFESDGDTKRFHLGGNVELLSDDRNDYSQGIWIRAWLDVDGDGEFSDGEPVLSTVRFPRHGQRLGFDGSLDLPPDGLLPATTWLRVIVAYGGPAGPGGSVQYGDVKDFLIRANEDGGSGGGKDVVGRGPFPLPPAAPGTRVRTTVELTERVPGALKGMLVFVSPKGTAVALVNGVRVKKGDIRIGKTRSKDDQVQIHVDGKSTVPSVIEFDIDLDVDSSYEGPIDLQTNLNNLSIRVARAAGGAGGGTVGVGATESPLPVVQPGLNDQWVSPIVINEYEAGGLKTGTVRFVSPKGTAVALRNGASVRVKQGNVRIGNVRVQGNTIEFDVLLESSEPSEIELQCCLDIEPTFSDPTVDLTHNIDGAGEENTNLTTVASAGG